MKYHQSESPHKHHKHTAHAHHRKREYRLLRLIEQRCTFLPGKLRGGIRCIADNGWRYTFRLGLLWMRTCLLRSWLAPLRLNKIPREPRLTVTLFSSPAQIDAVDQTLKTLLRQTVRPDRLVLWLAKSAFPAEELALPRTLTGLKRHGLTIRWCESARKDCGLLATSVEYPDDIVVTADDNLCFHPEMVGRLYEAYRKNSDMIHCHGAAQMRYLPETGTISASEHTGGYPFPSYCNLPVLGLGCLFPPEVLSAAGNALASSADDLNIWLYMLSCEIKANVVDHPLTDAESAAKLRCGISRERLDDLKETISHATEIQARLQNEQREMECLTLALKTPQTQKNYLYYKNLDPALYRAEITLWYQTVTQKRLDLDHPRSYNEKMQWMKLYDSTQQKAMLTDKFGMRAWLAEHIGSECLVKLYGVWDNADDIDFDSLPERFVLKAAHGSSWVMVVRDKRTLDIPQTREKLNSWLAVNFAFMTGLELHYMHIPPRIIAEEYMENAEGDLTDYKFWCFEGKVHSLAIVSGRSKASLKMSFFNLQWERITLRDEYPQHDKPIERPEKLQEMVALAERIAQGFAHVRVDLYLLNDGQIKLGECTFTSTSGTCHWSTPEVDRMMGDQFALPELTPFL